MGRKRFFLQHPQKSLLQIQRQFPHLVQKQGSAVRLLHQALVGMVRAGKGPPGVAEQHALGQVVRYGGAVHHHELAGSAGAVFMDGQGEKFLAGAGFAVYEHRGLRCGGLGQKLKTILHGFGVAHDKIAF